MIRRVLNLLPALSVLLCLAVAALWVRSYRVRDTLEWVADSGSYEERTLASARGGICCDRMTYDGSARAAWWKPPGFYRSATDVLGRAPVTVKRQSLSPWATVDFSWGGFQLLIADDARPHSAYVWRERSLTVPIWFLALLTAALPAWRLAGRRARRNRDRVSAGRCTTCGYYLAGNASGVCPECGTPAVPPAAS